MRSLILFFLISFLTLNIQAKNFGVVGAIFPIGELDMLVWIDNRLKGFEKSGEMERMKQEVTNTVKASVERPTPVFGISTTTTPQTFYVDPTLKLGNDIYDSQGKLLFNKGTTINPFDSSTWLNKDYPNFYFSKVLVFIDSDNEQQLVWAKNFKHEKTIKWILVNGSPNELSEILNTRIYFDQQGTLTSKLKIKNVPSVVSQVGTKWQIKEVDVSHQPL